MTRKDEIVDEVRAVRHPEDLCRREVWRTNALALIADLQPVKARSEPVRVE